MAISPPSDIVLDVANAASRSDVDAARAELRSRIAGKIATPAFDAAAPTTPSPQSADAPKSDAFVKFEAMVLQTFVQSMLPDKAEAVYGEGLSGDMWKGLLARELGQAMADRGGIGIADRLLADHYRDGEKTVALAGVSQGAAHEAADENARLSSALVQQLQRNLVRSLEWDDRPPATGVTATGETGR